MDEHYCVYALTRANGAVGVIGPGVDPRFPVELVRCGQLAALTSRVGLDQFDPAKLQEGTADVPWLTKVALRHNEIIASLARHLPVLPMRLGTFFASRSSLITRLTPYEARALEFLQHLEDRQEWAVKIYVDEDRAQRVVAANSAQQLNGLAQVGGGTQYLAAKAREVERRRQGEATVRQAIMTVEARLQDFADAWRRLRPLSATLTNRPEKMVWNGTFLLSRSQTQPFQAMCEQLRGELATGGLIVGLTGPWPPYHFCPSFGPEHEDSQCRCTC
jgi:hypothetical protein